MFIFIQFKVGPSILYTFVSYKNNVNMSSNLPLEVTREYKSLSFRAVVNNLHLRASMSTPCCATKGKFLLQLGQYAFEQNSIPYKKQRTQEKGRGGGSLGGKHITQVKRAKHIRN